MDIKDTATEALEKSKEVAGHVADKAKDLGHDALEHAKVAGDKIKEVAGQATKEGSFLDKLKDKAEEITHIDLNRDGKIGDKPKE